VDTQYRLLYKTLCDIEDVAGYTPAAVGETAKWTAIVSAVKKTELAVARLSLARYCSVPYMGPIQLH
jgi:hypothetical protein